MNPRLAFAESTGLDEAANILPPKYVINTNAPNKHRHCGPIWQQTSKIISRNRPHSNPKFRPSSFHKSSKAPHVVQLHKAQPNSVERLIQTHLRRTRIDWSLYQLDSKPSLISLMIVESFSVRVVTALSILIMRETTISSADVGWIRNPGITLEHTQVARTTMNRDGTSISTTRRLECKLALATVCSIVQMV